MMSSNDKPNKKRKANDGQVRADGAHDVNTGHNNDGGGFLSSWFGYFSGRNAGGALTGPPNDEHSNSIQQSLSQMNKIMMRMEEKLATVSSLESRCEKLEAQCSKLEDMLEAKCSSLETKLATTSQSVKDHMDRSLRYNEMRILNQKWKYSARVYSRAELMDANYDADEAEYIYSTCQDLKKHTESMRRGDFPTDNYMWNEKKVSLYTIDGDHSFDNTDANNALSPHWREFAAALKQFKPAFDILPNKCETIIAFGCVQLNREMTELIQEALVNMPFKKLSLEHTYRIHGGMSTIASIMTKNKYLQTLDIYQITDMGGNEVVELCFAIQCHPSIVDVSIINCFSGELGNEMLRLLLRTGASKLEKLTMNSNNISSVETLPDFLATNPRLTYLDLSDNELDDNDVVLIANALRSNKTLQHLIIEVDEVGEESLRVAVCGESSLNSVAASNHSCLIESDCIDGNESKSREINRGRKIYRILSSRNEMMCNAQDFVDIDVKLLPNIIEAVQKYSHLTEEDKDYHYVEALSVVYEVMRRWDKVSSLYKSLGKPAM